MSAALQDTTPPLLTYEDYLAEGEVEGRYDIIDGERIVTNPVRRHQTIALNIAQAFKRYAKSGKRSKAYIAPVDVLISRIPLRTRQPDVLLISLARLEQCGSDLDPAPLQVAPELVVEVLSTSDYRSTRLAKLEDYARVGVSEAWLVSPEAESVEVVSLSPDTMETRAVYAATHTARSLVFPDLEVRVEDLFED
jgi:Uma2 family endonuclease